MYKKTAERNIFRLLSFLWADMFVLISKRLFLVVAKKQWMLTTTSTRIRKLDARFFHMVFEEEIGRVKGHFGPINSVAFHPDGKRVV